MEKADRISSTFWLLFALVIIIKSYRLGLGSLGQPGPGFHALTPYPESKDSFCVGFYILPIITILRSITYLLPGTGLGP